MIDKIKIGYADYDVVDTKKKNLDGEFAHRDKELRISPKLKKEEKINTLIHEVLHGIWYQWGLNESVSGKNSEEIAVNALANGLTQVIRDNPMFLDTILELANHSWENHELYALENDEQIAASENYEDEFTMG